VLTAEDYEQAVRLAQDLLAAGKAIRAYWPRFNEVAEVMARINDQQVLEVRQLLSESSGSRLTRMGF
jgi:hypothetical protein